MFLKADALEAAIEELRDLFDANEAKILGTPDVEVVGYLEGKSMGLHVALEVLSDIQREVKGEWKGKKIPA